MSNEPRFLLGFGERLTSPTERAPQGMSSTPPYGFDEAANRLSLQLNDTIEALRRLPDRARPNNESVIDLTLHPQALAKSFHPKPLLEAYNLRQVGSKPTKIKPEKWTRKTEPTSSPSTTLFIAGNQDNFEQLLKDLREPSQRLRGDHIQRIELLEAPKASQRIHNSDKAIDRDGVKYYEAILHARPESHDGLVEYFRNFAQDIEVEVLIDKRVFAGGLCFIPIKCREEVLPELAQFSFLRSVRPASRLRSLAPDAGASLQTRNFSPSIQNSSPRNETSANVAILDGGFSDDVIFTPWANIVEPKNIRNSEPKFVTHGNDVLSAFLFGDITPDQPLDEPPALVDAWRILDSSSEEDPFELYESLHHVSSALRSGKYEFVNLSVGPAICIDDGDIHPWTAVIDEALADGQILATVAAGNNGEHPDNRVQVPSDCINALTVGAANSTSESWTRACYSAVGPGRSPGRIKPDLLAFGGSDSQPFHVAAVPSTDTELRFQKGTSFAAPLMLRQAVSLKKYFGQQLRPLAIKALLINSAEHTQKLEDNGWGRMNHDIMDIVTCGENEIRVVYQGRLEPSKYLRAGIPIPKSVTSGKVDISATFCYSTEVDPEDPGNYSRAGLGITFRPHSKKYRDEDSLHPDSDPFFQLKDFSTEEELRSNAHKWETVLHKTKTKFASSLHDPVFDIHYNARSNGGEAISPRPIPYALVVSVKSSKATDLYNDVVRQFSGILQPLRPVLDIPIQAIN